MTEDEMVGWHHRCDGHEFEQAPGVGDGKGGLEFSSPRGHRELERTEQLNNNNKVKNEEVSRSSHFLNDESTYCFPGTVLSISCLTVFKIYNNNQRTERLSKLYKSTHEDCGRAEIQKGAI